MNHKAVLVSHGDLSAEIDDEIAELVLSLWKAGVSTKFSCQDCGEGLQRPELNGWVSIQFQGEAPLLKLLNMFEPAMIVSDVSLYTFYVWKYDCYPFREDGKLYMMHNLYFPKEDINLILRAVSRHIEVAL